MCQFLSFLTDTGFTIPDITFSTTKGLIFANCFSSVDSRITKRGKDEFVLSLSKSLSEYDLLDDFMEAMNNILKFVRCAPHPPRSPTWGCAEGETHSPQRHQGYTPEILISGSALNDYRCCCISIQVIEKT